MHRLSPLLAAAGLVALLAAPAPALAADPAGIYVRPSTGTQVEFYGCDGKLCGKVVKVTDAKNQGNVGKVILNGAAAAGANKWKGDLLNLLLCGQAHLLRRASPGHVEGHMPRDRNAPCTVDR